MPKALSASLLAMLAVAASSCATEAAPEAAPNVPFEKASPWPKFRGNAQQDGLSSVKPTSTAGKFWAFQTGKGIFSSPVVAADGTVYIGSADRTFYALNADGTLRWKLEAEEIIDSAALLDDKGRVYFGAGDGKLRALDAKTGAPIWTMEADDPAQNKAFIRWFEGNVAMGPSGTLYVPNDNFFVYAIDRDTGSVTWRFKMPDQTWSLPAIDVRTETLFIGNNNLLPLLGKNTFAIDRKGEASWAMGSLGSIAASPMLTPEGLVVVGGFDGYLRAFDRETGDARWQFETRDHVYASPARLPDGTIVQPSGDGTIYAVRPSDGAQVWAFDTREPIRSSPAVDTDGNVYVGSGEGRLFVLTKEGKLRWSMRLVDDARNDLNASPALGVDAVYIAGESGQIFSVPYDYCLRAKDPRCNVAPGEDLPDSGTALYFTTPFGALEEDAPARIDDHQPITLSLVARENGDSRLAILDAASIRATVDPPVDLAVDVSGDGKFVTLTPKTPFVADANGKVAIVVRGQVLQKMQRTGLRLSGGEASGEVTALLNPTLARAEGELPAKAPKADGDPESVWEVSRLAIPMPTLMPSYNQIGFDSLHYLVGLVEAENGKGVAWMVGAKPGNPEAQIDPKTKGIFPLEVSYQGGHVTLLNEDGLSVEVMSFTLPFQAFRIAASLDAQGDAVASLAGGTTCAKVPLYGQFLQTLGLCNPQTDTIRVYGGANFTKRKDATANAGTGSVKFAIEGDSVVATLTGSSLKDAEELSSILLVDSATKKPITLSYGLDTKRKADGSGNLSEVAIALNGKKLPATVRAYLMIGIYPAARAELTIQR